MRRQTTSLLVVLTIFVISGAISYDGKISGLATGRGLGCGGPDEESKDSLQKATSAASAIDPLTSEHGQYSDSYRSDWTRLKSGKDLAKKSLNGVTFVAVNGEGYQWPDPCTREGADPTDTDSDGVCDAGEEVEISKRFLILQ